MAKLKLSFPSYQQPSMVTFGSGSIRTLAECAPLKDSAIFLSGREEVRNVVERSLSKRGIDLGDAPVLVKPAGEPTLEMVKLGAAFLKKQPFQRVIGIGGGSVMDWCRLSWAESEEILKFDGQRALVEGSAPRTTELWLVPSTCGTGGEAANIAVFSHEGRKIPAVSRAFVADRVVLDGQFLSSVGPAVLANSLCDALSHAIEAYVSILPCPLAKEAAVSALTLIFRHYTDGSPSRNDRLMEAGYLGGVAAANCSVGAIHAFAHTIAAYGVSHGHANALGLIAGVYSNQDVPAMQALLGRCGARTIDEFIDQLRPIVQTALSRDRDMELLQALRDQSALRLVSEQMSADVCMRSSPRALEPKEVPTFLEKVAETVECL